MRAYVTKKEYLCLSENSGKKQRSPRIIKRKESEENRKTPQGTVELLLKAFNGEIVGPLKEKLFTL